MSRTAQLTSYVKARDVERKNQEIADLVEEGKLIYQASQTAKLSEEAKKAHSKDSPKTDIYL
jgi:hypothetical protein